MLTKPKLKKTQTPKEIMNKQLSEILKRRLSWFMIPLLTIAFAPAYGQGEASEEDEGGEIIVLSPFSIVEDTDEGYVGKETLAGTRVKANVADLGASITLLTQEFMNDIAANDLMEILPYVGQTEVGGIFGNFSGEGNTNFFGQNRPTTFLRQHPHTQTRVRGLDAADLTRDYSLTDIPLDGYIVDRVAIQRGANSMLFGLGSPAGLINSQVLTARMDRDQFRGMIRSDNYGSIRATMDVNKIIWEDKLAVRVAALYEDQEYVQEPTFEEDRRIFTTFTFKPYKYTTIKASFEAGEITSNRPDIMAPMNLMSQNWFDAGTPAATLEDYEADRQIGHPFATGPFWGHITAPYEVYASSSDVPNGQYGGVGLMQRRNLGQIECWTNRANQANPNADGTLPGLVDFGTKGTSCYELNTDGTKATNSAGLFIPIVDPLGPIQFMTSGGFHPQNIGGGRESNDPAANFCVASDPVTGGPLCHSRSQEESFNLDDISWVQYDKFKFMSPELGEEDFTSIDINFQQLLLTDREGMSLAFDFLWHLEDYNANFWDGQWDGLTSGIFVDVNPILFDGRTNPNFMRPAVANFRPENQHDNFERESRRVTVNFEIDLTNHEGILKHLGRHSITGLYNDQYNYAFHGEGFTRTSPAPRNDDERDAWFGSVGGNSFELGAEHGYICYVGPPIAPGTARNQVVINDTCPASALPIINEDFSFTAWDRNSPNDTFYGQQFVELDGVVSGARHRKVNVSLENAESIVFIDHAHWFNGNLVSTLGWRQDEVFLENFPGDRDNQALHRPLSWHNTSMAGDAKTTIFSWGLVGHVPDGILPDGWGLRGHYSKSQNFLPAAGRTDAEGMPQDSPGGTTKEYGFSVDLGSRVTLKMNWYESAVANNAVATAIGHNENFGSSLIFGHAIGWISGAGNQFNEGDPYGIVTTMEDMAARVIATSSPTHQTAWSWSRPSRFTATEGDPANTVQIADTVSEGLEVELMGSPIRGLNVGLNLSQQKVIQTNIARRFIALFERERAELEALTISSQNGFVYNSAEFGLPGSGEYQRIEEIMFRINNGSGEPMPVQKQGFQTSINSLSSRVEQVKRTDGQVSLEVREWRFNAFGNYAFQGDGLLKGFGIGGAVRWQDTVALDYHSEIFVDDTGQTLLTANLNDPVIDKAQTQADVWFNYRRKIFDMDWTFRLNVRNAIRGDAAVAAIGQPDYRSVTEVAMYRIVQPTTFIFSAAFEF